MSEKDESAAPEQQPVRIWALHCPFTKKGFPERRQLRIVGATFDSVAMFKHWAYGTPVPAAGVVDGE